MMASKNESRLSSLDLEKILENSTGMYSMVIAASALHRDIRRKNKHSNRYEHLHAGVTALKEIQDGKHK